MNITLVIGGLSGGGAERVVCNLGNFLSRKHNVTILTMTEDIPVIKLNKNIKRVSLLNKKEKRIPIFTNIIRYKRFRSYLSKGNADIYVVMLPGTINLLLAHKHLIKSPIIISERNDPTKRFYNSFVQNFLMKKLYIKADEIVFQTEEVEEFYQRTLHLSGKIIPNAINEDFLDYSFDGKRSNKIVSVGRFNEQKNFPMLIHAFHKIHKEFPNYKLIIFGEGSLRNDLENLILKLDLQGKVILPGYVNYIQENIQDSSLFVLPSNFEGMPNALMEAMALGIPSISTDCPVGGPRFLIEDGVNGFLVPVGDIDALSEKMRLLLSDSEKSRSFSILSKDITKKLNPEKIYGMWEKLIVDTLQNN